MVWQSAVNKPAVWGRRRNLFLPIGELHGREGVAEQEGFSWWDQGYAGLCLCNGPLRSAMKCRLFENHLLRQSWD